MTTASPIATRRATIDRVNAAIPFFTVGHSNRTLADFITLLSDAGVGLIVDVRKLTGSRSQPHFNDDVLARQLPLADIEYRRLASLGGRRAVSKDVAREVNGLWRNRSFQNYADWTLSEEFRDGLRQLRAWGHQTPTAVMCAEAVWWRCHRRIIADNLLAHDEDVRHIMDGRLVAADLTPGAHVGADRRVTYPAA